MKKKDKKVKEKVNIDNSNNVTNSVNDRRTINQRMNDLDNRVKESQYKESNTDELVKKKKAKEKRMIAAAIACLAIVLAGAIATYSIAEYEQKKKFEEEKKIARENAIKDSKNALVKYYQCINAGDYSTLYLGIDNETKAKRAEDNFIFVNKAFYEELNMHSIKADIKSCKLKSEMNVEKDKKDAENSTDSNTEETKTSKDKYGASEAVIDYTVTMTMENGEIKFDNTADLVKEGESWHIVWNSGLIYPEYEPLDKVTSTYTSLYRGDILDRNGEKLATVKDNVRYYPYGEKAAHLVGFVARITQEELERQHQNGNKSYGSNSFIGTKGLEYCYEDTVRGKGGHKITLSDSKGNLKKVLLDTQPTKGQDMQTTIDIKVQEALYKQLKDDNGCSVAINPRTGEILAMVSTPSYDNNGILKGTTSDTYNRFARSFSPGSTFKPLTGAIGLDCDAFTAETNFGRSPMKWQKDKSWGKLFVTTTHSSNGTLKNAITVSDNVYFAKAALKIGSTNMKNGLEDIGFNQKLPIIMNFNASQYSNGDTFSSEGMLANSGYGQGQILVNPLHMASIYSAFVNEGNMIKPVFTYDGKPEYWIENAFKKETAETILDCLKNVVRSGTATRLYSSRLVVAGKTGTAEIKASQTDNTGTELGWFVAVTPEEEENPIIIVTMIENVKNRGGSSYVVRKTRNMLKDIYDNY